MIPIVNNSKMIVVVVNYESYMAKSHSTASAGGRVVSQHLTIHHTIPNGL